MEIITGVSQIYRWRRCSRPTRSALINSVRLKLPPLQRSLGYRPAPRCLRSHASFAAESPSPQTPHQKGEILELQKLFIAKTISLIAILLISPVITACTTIQTRSTAVIQLKGVSL